MAACPGGLGVDGGAAEVAVAGRTSLLSHLFFRLQPPHHRSLSSLKRARQVVPLGLSPPSSLSVAGTGSPGGRDPSARLVVEVPGPPTIAIASWVAVTVTDGRRRSHPRWFLHPLHHLVRSGCADRQARGRLLLVDEAGCVPRAPSSPGSSPRAGATALEPVVPPVAVAASAPASVSAGSCGGSGGGVVGDGGAGAGGSGRSAAGPGSGGGAQSCRAATL